MVVCPWLYRLQINRWTVFDQIYTKYRMYFGLLRRREKLFWNMKTNLYFGKNLSKNKFLIKKFAPKICIK